MFNYSTLILFWFLIVFSMPARKKHRSQKAGSNGDEKRIKYQDKCIVCTDIGKLYPSYPKSLQTRLFFLSFRKLGDKVNVMTEYSRNQDLFI